MGNRVQGGAWNINEPTRPIQKSIYFQHRNGAIVWVHNKVEPHQTVNQHRAAWNTWVESVIHGTAQMKTAAVVGDISQDVLDWLKRSGKPVPSRPEILATRKAIQHAMSQDKASKGAGISEEEIKSLPDHLAHPGAVLWDDEDPALVYVFDRDGSKLGKIIVRVNYREKGYGEVNSFRTAGMVDTADLKVERYKKIRGSL